MIIGVPKEIKIHEYRVGMTHYGVKECTSDSHEVWVEKGAGIGIGISDQMFSDAGAKIAGKKEVFERAEMIVKVKEPLPEEYGLLRENHILFTYLHLASSEQLTKALIDSRCTGIAYETVTDSTGKLPLLTPMSLIAGRLSVESGAFYSRRNYGGKGKLFSGAPGVKNGKVVIIGGGVVGINAARIALGMGAQVIVFDNSDKRLQEIDNQFQNSIQTLYSTEELLKEEIHNADLIIGAVLVQGASSPKVITKEMLKIMEPGTVIVDVAIDQGGCFETSKPTTHDDPTFVFDDVIHYCVANMPGAVALTATYALTNSTLPYILKLANYGKSVLKEDPHFLNGLNVYKGQLTCKAVAESFKYQYTKAENCL